MLSENNKILRETERAIARSQQSVFEAAFRKSIPQNVFDAVNETVFARKFYRTNCQASWRFRLSELSGQPRLTAYVTNSYGLKNLTGSEEEYTMRHEIERSSKPPGGSPIKLIQVNGVTQDLSALTPSQEDSDNDIVSYELPPIKVPGSGFINVTSTFEFVRNLEDRDIWYTIYAAEGMTLIVYDPDDCIRIGGEFRVAPIGDLQVKVTHSDASVTAQVFGTVLPYQGLMFSWKYEKRQGV